MGEILDCIKSKQSFQHGSDSCSWLLSDPVSFSITQEDCDLENVWLMGGLSVLTSVPGGPPMVCLLCASKGLHEVGTLLFFFLDNLGLQASIHPGLVPWLSSLILFIISLSLLVGLLPSLL